jgi:NAD-dependent deacetylase
MSSAPSSWDALAAAIRAARRICVFSGAGISTESGISDYRSRGGLWDRFRPVTIQEFLAGEPARVEYWTRKRELYENFLTAKPNAAHRAIVRLHGTGRLRGVITQNIDGLHQAAGLPADAVLEVHGSNRTTRCLGCGASEPWERTFERLRSGAAVPRCDGCGGLLKPATISFGEALDPDVLRRAADWAGSCDLMLVVGSTLVVEPAASLPRIAKGAGAALAIVNLSETPQDADANVVVRGRAGEVLDAVICAA